jgi:uncharacterized protein (TIGR00255 family)
MISSMTGYGEVQCSDGDISYVLELRTVNSRYLKFTIKLPDSLSIFEPQLEQLLRTRLTRGSVAFTLRVRDSSAEAAQEVNQAAVIRYVQQLRAVLHEGPVRVDLATLLMLPGVCQPPPIDESKRARQWEVLERLTGEALDRLMEMRRIEGRGLAEDFSRQCAAIRENLQAVAERAPTVLAEYHQRLCQRANELLAESRLQLVLDDVRREVALYAERCDINEEVARLRSHLDQFERACGVREPVGRKLDFLSQEMLREANTLGSKANDAAIAQHVIEIKGAIDRIKEQVQNVE